MTAMARRSDGCLIDGSRTSMVDGSRCLIVDGIYGGMVDDNYSLIFRVRLHYKENSVGECRIDQRWSCSLPFFFIRVTPPL